MSQLFHLLYQQHCIIHPFYSFRFFRKKRVGTNFRINTPCFFYRTLGFILVLQRRKTLLQKRVLALWFNVLFTFNPSWFIPSAACSVWQNYDSRNCERLSCKDLQSCFEPEAPIRSHNDFFYNIMENMVFPGNRRKQSNGNSETSRAAFGNLCHSDNWNDTCFPWNRPDFWGQSVWFREICHNTNDSRRICSIHL